MESTTAGQARIKTKAYHYKASLEWTHARSGVTDADGKPSINVSSPPEFRGEEGVWTPEDFFVAAINACTMTTFLSFAEREKLEIEGYRSEADGTLEMDEGTFRFTRVVVRPTILVRDESRVAATLELMHKAHEKCLIANSVRSVVEVETRIEVLG